MWWVKISMGEEVWVTILRMADKDIWVAGKARVFGVMVNQAAGS